MRDLDVGELEQVYGAKLDKYDKKADKDAKKRQKEEAKDAKKRAKDDKKGKACKGCGYHPCCC